MIFSLSGTVGHIDSSFLELQCNGIGYKVFVSHSILGSVLEGETLRLYIYDIIRENAHDIYGFKTMEERRVYELLLSVSGVGPKTALSILNAASIENLLQGIVAEDASVLHSVSGIGKKTAAKVIIDLKNKIDPSFLVQISVQKPLAKRVDVMQALESLGYASEHARRAMSDIPDDFPDDETLLLKEALRIINSF